MTFRNDHDAALHRVDALENELDRLRKAYDEAERRRLVPQAPRRNNRVLIAVAVGIATLGGSAAMVHALQTEPVAQSEIEALDQRLEGDWITTCVKAIEPRSIRLDAITTDPRATSPEPVTQITHTAASCRLDLPSVKSAGDFGDRVAAWSAGEDELAGAISRILVYYDSDPYQLDGYSSAPQLWREYHDAVAARDQALAQVIPLL